MGGSGGTRTETGTLPASIPPQLQPLVDAAVAGSIGAMGDVPLSQFAAPNPQQIPDLTSQEGGWIDAINQWASSPDLTMPYDTGMAYTGQGAGASPYEGLGAYFTTASTGYDPYETGGVGGMRGSAAYDPYETSGVTGMRGSAGYDPFEQLGGLRMQSGGDLSAGEQLAMGILGERYGGPTGIGSSDVFANVDTANMRRAQALADQLTSGDVGSSPATLQAMKAWEELTKPQVLAAQAISGNLGGGSTQEAMAHGSTEALTPLLAKEIDTRQAISNMLGQFGLTESSLNLQAATSNADRALRAEQASVQAGLEAAGLDRSSAAQLASVAAGAKGRELQAGGALASLGGAKKAREYQAGAGEAAVGSAKKAREYQAGAGEAAIGAGRAGRQLTAGGQLAAIGSGQQNRQLAAGAQMGALGTQKAQTQISAMTTALEKAGMPREIAGQQAQAAYNDFLRRQGMAESLYMGPTGNYLAGALTPGSLVQSRQTGGGMFGS